MAVAFNIADMHQLSIIIPVYNVASYLRNCLDSLLSQTFTDWEAICVDDGSVDDSGAILDEYAAQDSRFRVIHQPNAGVSTARQRGVDEARGRYIGWVDPDDWVETRHFEKLYCKTVADGADIVWSDTVEEKDGVTQIIKNKCQENACEMLKAILRRDIRGSLWGKIFSREFIKKSGARFPTRCECEIMEDNYFLAGLLIKNPSVRYLQDASYHYVIHNGSLSNQGCSLEWWQQAMRATDAMVAFLQGRFDASVLDYRLAQLKNWMLFEKNVPNEVFWFYHPEIATIPPELASLKQRLLFAFATRFRMRSLLLRLRG